MMTERQTHRQNSQWDSPWPVRVRIRQALWELCWALLCAWTPKPLNRWRLLWLRLFGARIDGRPFVHQRARIHAPWRLTLHSGSCLGDRAHAYCLGEIELGENATVAQEAYLCTGTHDFDDPTMPLVTAKIAIGPGAFVGARAFVLPGVTVGARAVVGACAVVTRDVPSGARVKGNPAR